jgi:hypothetical protein
MFGAEDTVTQNETLSVRNGWLSISKKERTKKLWLNSIFLLTV